jgi:ribosomal protein S18 acetylase RimI-like enzyme
MASVTLRPMTDDEFGSWLPSVRSGYANELISHGGADPAAARATAELETEQLFPDGKSSRGQLVFVIESRGERVGELWLAEQERDFRRVLWVFDIHVDERHRGRGFARAAMELAEREAKRRGLTHVALNVFGGNEPARRLYRSLGYTEDAISMSKAV